MMSRIGNAIILALGFGWILTMLGIAHNDKPLKQRRKEAKDGRQNKRHHHTR